VSGRASGHASARHPCADSPGARTPSTGSRRGDRTSPPPPGSSAPKHAGQSPGPSAHRKPRTARRRKRDASLFVAGRGSGAGAPRAPGARGGSADSVCRRHAPSLREPLARSPRRNSADRDRSACRPGIGAGTGRRGTGGHSIPSACRGRWAGWYKTVALNPGEARYCARRGLRPHGGARHSTRLGGLIECRAVLSRSAPAIYVKTCALSPHASFARCAGVGERVDSPWTTSLLSTACPPARLGARGTNGFQRPVILAIRACAGLPIANGNSPELRGFRPPSTDA